ncbi:MAG: phenylacetate-CoA oxygenase subunit PaaC [Gammaproteobacteria bacterium]|nr:phenylacetate-CoA oxygenase subunit PaaC [Gammaproteobacteria bacterium]MBT8094362.1 phenylacetate-CoA oxygenase subunit PaaC [Gammaproteobacteria bacterium]MBT8106566.1 phenylacetate-CoA oxygenase subunit PaaC [Gammaproteobacteria bacterium]NNK26581.1 phenylacetate-CoA oxygenase subunit PaaC [Woeseiaceae bacterium]NNL64482.1 phenylacetate-CoA oxygenase subunit PaaC [Woeseiaceae bacterium]
MTDRSILTAYATRLGDNALVLGQRMIEFVAASPELEEELANANFALDYIGQARMFYTCAGESEGKGRSEDDFAFLRPEHEYRNLLLVEQPHSHFGDAIVRQFLFDAFYAHQLDALAHCADEGLAEIAARAVKEVRYHLRHSSQWLVRLGDGTAESHERVQRSLDDLWRFTGEMFDEDELDTAMRKDHNGPCLVFIEAEWRDTVSRVIDEATLSLPEDGWMASGGKQGRHSEHMGFLLAELQYLQRTYPGASW